MRRGAPAMSKVTQAVVLACIWAIAIMGTLEVATLTAFGPVLVTLGHQHGVHLGDVIAGVVILTVAITSTMRLLLRWTER
jgi:hypothetical protein